MDIVNEVSLVEERALSLHIQRYMYTYISKHTMKPNKGGPLEELRYPDRIYYTSI